MSGKDFGRKMTAEEKERAIALSRGGLDKQSIAAQLGVHPARVNGVIETAKNRGLIGEAAPPFTSPIPETTDMGDSVPAPAASVLPPQQQQTQQQPAPSPSASIPDGFSGGRSVVGGAGGSFTSPTNQIKWIVERIVPPDGLLGTHLGPFGPQELGETYGAGTYKITKQEGKTIVEYLQKVSAEAYGESRSPNSAPARPAAPRRPFLAPRAGAWSPYDRSAGAAAAAPAAGGEGEEDPGAAYRRSPWTYPHYLYPQYYQPQQQDRTIVEFAKQTATAGEGAASKAIEMAERMHERSLEQIEAARKGGPDSYVAKFLEAQQEVSSRRWEEERRRDDERRTAEETKWERQRQEERERREADRRADEARHEREMQRIKAESDARLAEQRAAAAEREAREIRDREDREKRAEADRKFLLEIEDKRLALLKQEAEIQQRRLESEISQTREEMKSLQERTAQELSDSREATARAIQENREATDKRLEREREILDQTHRLREKHMDREHELQQKHFEMQRQMVEQQSGDQMYNTFQTIIKEGAKGWEKFVDLQKLQAMTPEAQAAAVARGAIDGNVVVPQAQQAQAPQLQGGVQAVPAGGAPQAAAAQPPSGNGHPQPQEAGFQEELEANIKEALGRPMFRAVIKEWSAHVEAGNDPTMFANIFLEFMRDPVRHEVRQGCSIFAGFMSIRPWPKMREFLRPHLDADVNAIFDRPDAGDFYEAFRAMVAYQVREYWQQCLAVAKAEEERRRPAAQAGAQQPQPQQQPPQGRAPVEPQAPPKQAEPQPQQPEGAPVPQREAPGQQAA